MSGPRIGALCAGYGGLDRAVQEVLGGELAWIAEKDPAAAKLLAHRFPGVPNLGDITEVDWAEVEPVDIVTAGFPCQDVSLAGRRAGLAEGTRSGLWRYIRDGLAVLRPSLVIIENVRGLLSARADGGVEPGEACLGDGPDVPVLRALGAVLGDLAELGLDAEWVGLPASGVGACHGRFRVGVLAWPAAYADVPAGARQPDASVGVQVGGAAARRGGAGSYERDAPAHSDGVRPLRSGPARRRRGRPKDDGLAAATDPDGLGLGPDERQLRTGQPHAAGRADGDASGVCEPDEPLGGVAAGLEVVPVAGAVHRDRERDPAEGVHELGRAAPELAWGPYGPAVRRWELTIGRPAPAPTEPGQKGQPRLSPRFVEWMQGLPEGWVTDVPGLSRNDQLRLLGNGVVPQQFAEAIRFLLARAFGRAAA